MWRIYASAAALGALVAAGVYVQSLRGQNDRLVAQVASLQREAQVAAAVARQKTEAAAVARADAERLAVKAAEYDATREWILRNDDHAPIPPLLRDALDRLLHRAPR